MAADKAVLPIDGVAHGPAGGRRRPGRRRERARSWRSGGTSRPSRRSGSRRSPTSTPATARSRPRCRPSGWLPTRWSWWSPPATWSPRARRRWRRSWPGSTGIHGADAAVPVTGGHHQWAPRRVAAGRRWSALEAGATRGRPRCGGPLRAPAARGGDRPPPPATWPTPTPRQSCLPGRVPSTAWICPRSTSTSWLPCARPACR